MDFRLGQAFRVKRAMLSLYTSPRRGHVSRFVTKLELTEGPDEGTTLALEEAKQEGYLVHLHESTVNVEHAQNGDKYQFLLGDGISRRGEKLRVPITELQIHLGSNVFVEMSCTGCTQVAASVRLPTTIRFDLCAECLAKEKESGAPPDTAAQRLGRVVDRFDRAPHDALVSAFGSMCIEHGLRDCPYEPHDTRRVIDWLRQHPTHRLQLWDYLESVDRALTAYEQSLTTPPM